MLAGMGLSGALDWDVLLKSKRILIISEAGSGKTYECRAQQQALWDNGEPAFYLDLAQLATNELRQLLSIDEEKRLNAWLVAQSDVATFFLDSIDELKLTLGSFETSLRRLTKAIAGQLGRLRIVITTRPIPVDQQLIQQYLPIPDPVKLLPTGDAFADIAMGKQRRSVEQGEKDRVPAWRNVALMPFFDRQIREMATVEGIDDADALLADIRARNAEDFARRPQDLVELCADWREHRRIRTHREQVAQNASVKLKPRSDRREPAQLSPNKAFEGASRLALAALLTRKLTIRLSVEADRGGDPGTALDPASILGEWTPKERETLLERGLFGFASYGRVRFHHRSVIEFLAAQRLHDRLSQGMPIKAVKRLLFAETPQGIKVVRPTMRAVAAWLAAQQPSIFFEVLNREPMVLFDHADPEALTLPQRVDALRSYVHLFGSGGYRGLHVHRVQVRRFASPDLANHVQNLWWAGIENNEVRELLLDLIGAGKMSSCADIAYGVATDGSSIFGERLDAIDALVNLNDSRIEGLTQLMLDQPALWSDPLARRAIVRLFPNHITPTRFCDILKRVQGPSSRAAGEIDWMLPRSITESDFSPGYATTLREGLTDLVTESLVWKPDWPHLISKRPHLLPALTAICLKQVLANEPDEKVLHSAVVALRLQHGDNTGDDVAKELRNALGNLLPSLREVVFWADDRLNESLHPQSDLWQRLYRTGHHGPLDLNEAQDGAWIRRILADPTRSLPERTMMLHALMHDIWNGTDDRRRYLQNLKQYVADQPDFIVLIDGHLAPQKMNPEQAKFEAQLRRRRKAEEKRKAKNHADWVAFWRGIADNPQTAFSPDRAGKTAWNLWQAMGRSGDESRASGWNRRFIEKYFSKEIADQLRDSMRSIWRNDRPTLRYERAVDKRGTILIRWQFGLAAIAAEAEDPTWARKLSVEEAELAARYVPIEFNGFPAWLEALAREHPVAVERTLRPELIAELEEEATLHSFGILLQSVSHAPSVVAQIFLPTLRAWLDVHAKNRRNSEDEAAAIGRLERVLDIVFKHGDDEARSYIRALADDQLKVAGDSPFIRLWLMTLMRLDPIAGTDALDRFLAPIEPAAAGVGTDVFGSIFSDHLHHRSVDASKPHFSAPLLLRLVRLAYRYIRHSDDIEHETIYRPGPRDSAQHARNALLNAILNTTGTEAWAVKIEMVNDPLFAHFRDRLTVLALEKAAEEADSAVFPESQVIAFDRYGEASPATRDDMFAVLVDRLEDLDDLLLRDDSPRAAWATIKDERMMRQQIALQLRQASNHVYTVDQEAVTADEKETDIRLRAASSSQQSTIELKIGESWSGRQLRETIENQLVKKYMAAESCRSGCLLVTIRSNRTWKDPDTNENLDADGLQKMLNVEAGRIVNKLGTSLRLFIKVLDLRPRLSRGSKSNLKAKAESKPKSAAKSNPPPKTKAKPSTDQKRKTK